MSSAEEALLATRYEKDVIYDLTYFLAFYFISHPILGSRFIRHVYILMLSIESI